jgi:predicted transglutaminase-like cysteine proteinase
MSGEVRAWWRVDGTTYVLLYSHAAREERVYELDERGIARPSRGTGGAEDRVSEFDTPAPRAPDRRGGAYRPRRRGAWVLSVILGVAVLALPLLTAGLAELRARRLSYGEFLDTGMSLERMTSTVAARIDYERDVEEFWSPADGVWDARRGDCEDYAMVVSAWLEAQGIEHTVVGFPLEESLDGHAAVIAETDDARVLIDPTMATAPTGVRFFPREASGSLPDLATVLSDYAAFPAATYESPPEAGRPSPTGFVE